MTSYAISWSENFFKFLIKLSSNFGIFFGKYNPRSGASPFLTASKKLTSLAL